MIRALGPNFQKQRPAVGESTWNREVDNPNHPSKNVSKPSKRRNLSNSKHVQSHDKLNTTPTQKHIQKDGSKNAMSTKTCQNLEASTPNTYIRVFEDAQHLCQNHHKIGPKIIKNPPKIDPWTPPGPLLEQRSLLRPLISPFLAPKGSPMGP